jgi:hypothetical protein
MQRPPTCFEISRGNIQEGNKKDRRLKDDRIIAVTEINPRYKIRAIRNHNLKYLREDLMFAVPCIIIGFK